MNKEEIKALAWALLKAALTCAKYATFILMAFAAGFGMTKCSGPTIYHVYKTSAGVMNFTDGRCLNGLFVNYDAVNLLGANGLPVTCENMLKVDADELDRLKTSYE